MTNLSDIKRKASVDYWRKKMASVGTLPKLALPLEKSPSSKTKRKRAKIRRAVPILITKRIDALCSGSPILIYNFYVSVLACILARYNIEDQPIIATSSFKLDNQKKVGLIFFKFDLSSEITFKELFAATKQEVLTAIDYQGITIDPSNFDVWYQDENLQYPLEAITPGICFTTSKAEKLTILKIKFDAEHYEAELIDFFASTFIQYLKVIPDHLHVPVRQLGILGSRERKIILENFRSNDEFGNHIKPLVSFIESQSEQKAEKVAFVSGHQHFTYRYLHEKSNQLANLLYDQLVTRGTGIAILMDRSIEMVISILAVWKSGAYYLPLEISWPDARINTILLDAQPQLILTLKVFEDRIYHLSHLAKSFFWEMKEISDQPTSFIVSTENDIEDIAYVIYTSGSTGKPKGVVVEHLGMMNHMLSKIHDLEITEQTILAQTASHCFDISVWQFFASVVTGGKTVIIESATVLSVKKFMSEMEGKRITILELVPSYLSATITALQDNREPSPFSGLEYLLVTGETVKSDLLKKWFDKEPSVIVVNAYGPTEASDDVTHFFIPKFVPFSRVPIGKPIGGFAIYILDEYMNLCPIGAIGEICVVGIGVGRGYLNDVEMTDRLFLKDPFQPLDRLFKTGDIGRYMNDGNIEFLGRRDYQVKIRGHRIELEEIETMALEVKGLSDAVALFHCKQDEPSLYLFILCHEPLISIEKIRKALSSVLPNYMLPKEIIILEKFPLNTNGKTDRNALISRINKDVSCPGDGAKTNTHLRLLAIWKDVLKVTNLTIKANFFKAGGQSLKATIIAYRVSKEFGIQITVRDIFTAYSIALLAEVIENKSPVQYSDITPLPLANDYPVSAGQKRIWVTSQISHSPRAYQLSGAVSIEGDLSIEVLGKSLRALVERHESLRTTFLLVDDHIRQKVHSAETANFRLHRIDLRDDPHKNEKVQEILNNQVNHSFNLETDILFRSHIIHLHKHKFIFFISVHHIVMDNWSENLIIEELSILYKAFINNEKNPLFPLPFHYKDYAAWQLGQISDSSWEEHKGYWRKEFENQSEILDLPTDFSRPAIMTNNAGHYRSVLQMPLTFHIKEISQEYHVTVHMTLLAMVFALLHRYTGQKDIIIGIPISGRNHPDLENQIGFYLNTLPIRVQLKDSFSFQDLLNEVKEKSLQGYEHRAYPIDQILQDIGGRSDLSRAPLFDVLVISEETENIVHLLTEVKGINVKSYETSIPTTSNDLTWSFTVKDRQIDLLIEYNSDLYTIATIERWAGHFEVFANQLLTYINYPFNTLQYLTELEKEQLLLGFNNTFHDYQSDKTITSLFEGQVKLLPDHIALTFEDRSYSFRCLNEIVNKLAHHIRGQYEISANDKIAIMMARSEWAVVGILAVLKAGAAYVPIELDEPEARITKIINSTRFKAILLDREESVNRRNFEKIPCLVIDFQWARCSNSFSTNPKPITTPDHLGYIMYTSGSTGEPKGVMVPLRGIVNHIAWRWKTFGFSTQDIILQRTTYTFDVSAWEIFLPLCFGAKLLVCPDKAVNNFSNLIGLLYKQRVSSFQIVPSVYKSVLDLINQSNRELLKNVRTIFAGGESLPVQLANLHHSVIPWVRLIGVYGPTETTIDVTYFETSPGNTYIPIGRPVWNSQLYIVDPRMALVPIGFVGEIIIGGEQVAKGYLKGESQGKFIPDIFSSKKKTLYKTGDFGKFLPDGNILFMGRKDNQVKIRGFRIEIGEIIKAILDFQKVKRAAVKVVKNKIGEKFLIAYIEKNDTRLFEVSDLPIEPSVVGKSDSKEIEPLNETILNDLNNTCRAFPKEKSIVHFLEEHASKRPEYLAVNDGNESWTYGFLNRKANQIAHLLLSIGVRSGELVPVYLDRSANTLAVMLGIFKAKAVYVPVDPTCPVDRVRFIIEDTTAKILISCSQKISLIHALCLELSINTLLHTIILTDKVRESRLRRTDIERFALANLMPGLSDLKQKSADSNISISTCKLTPYENQLISKTSLLLRELKELITGSTRHVAILFDNPDYQILSCIALYSMDLQPVVLAKKSRRKEHVEEIKKRSIQWIISERIFMDHADALRWECPGVKGLILLDSYDANVHNYQKEEFWKEIWEHQSKISTNKVNDYGWTNSYTKEAFSTEEITEYISNFKIKLRPYLKKNTQVLEVGSGSGLVLFEIAPQVASYHATDLAETMLRKVEKRATEKEIENVKFDVVSALQIDQVATSLYDIIICSSVIHYFPNTEYLKCFIGKAILLIKDTGIIYLDDLIDIYLKNEIIDAAHEFNEKLGVSSAKVDWDDDLMIDKIFFENLKNDFPEIAKYHCSRKLGKTRNELTRFRYDVIIEIDKKTIRKGSQELIKQFICIDIQNKPIDKLLMLSDSDCFLLSRVRSFGNVYDASDLIQAPNHNPNLSIRPDDLCYLIYTSGSTDKPKGVMIEYAGMMNHLWAKVNDLKLDLNSIIVQNASPAFDISIWQFLAAIIKGGKTCVCKDDVVKNLVTFLTIADARKITILEVVPSYLAALLETISLQNEKFFASLKYLLITGEEVKPKLVSSWFDHFQSITLVNAYGPTEVSDDVTHYFMDRAPNLESIPIGKTIQNLKIYIVDHQLKLMPIGEKGEIIVCGVGLARGYLNDIPKTAASFVQAPDWVCGFDRIYRTGDIGRIMPDGYLEFSGRKDEQIKINGHRIEPGEIEHSISQINSVRQVMVVSKKNELGQKYLCAYVVIKSGLTLTRDSIRNFLLTKIPKHMIPSYFVFLDSLPLNANGKVDRSKLPAPELDYSTKFLTELRTYLSQKIPIYMMPGDFKILSKMPLKANGKIDYQSLPHSSEINHHDSLNNTPKNEIQSELLRIWRSVLGQNNIGIYHNFFEIGGQSLKAIQAVSRINIEMRKKITLEEFFVHPTIEDLSKVLENEKRKAYVNELRPIEEQQHYQISPAQRRVWLLSQNAEASLAYNALSVLRIKGDLKLEAFVKSFLDLTERHEILRTTFISVNGRVRQKISRSVSGITEVIDLQQMPDASVKLSNLIEAEKHSPFDFQEGPLFQMKIVLLTDRNFMVLLKIHHIVIDGLSLENIIREVGEFYDMNISATAFLIPPLRIQYKDYTCWLNGRIAGISNEHRKYWMEKLQGNLPRINLNFSKPRPDQLTYAGRIKYFKIGNDLSDALRNFIKRHNTTLFTIILSVIKIVLSKYTGHDDIIVGSPVLGRDHPDLEKQIGMYLNYLILRDQLPGEMKFEELVLSVRNTLLEAYDHQLYPYEKIIEDLHISESDRNPLYDVLVVMGTTGETNYKFNNSLKSLYIENENPKFNKSKLDLSFFINDAHNLELTLEYRKELYKEKWIDRLVRDIRRVISKITKDSKLTIREIKAALSVDEVKGKHIKMTASALNRIDDNF